ncbi:MAG: NUDIX domain-containing protein [Rickettsiales bacterium]|jgi:ADP-ribose pyrophosphatase YjhB (NUDIX family)|nr:NUDIX domain-containing protein [Rickettsiales bacterium]
MSEAQENKIRAIAVAVIRKGDKILGGKGIDASANKIFYRLIGGGIEFGETSDVALKREFMEEMNAEIIIKKFLGVGESIFVYEGQSGHQLVFFYEAEFVDKKMYEQDEFKMLDVEEDHGHIYWADPKIDIIYPDAPKNFDKSYNKIME